jgi:hypothetical protein
MDVIFLEQRPHAGAEERLPSVMAWMAAIRSASAESFNK